MRTGSELKSQIVKGIQRLAKTTAPQVVFRHWCEAMALAIQNACLLPGTQRWKQNEEAYLAIVKEVGSDAMQEFKRLFELYQELLTVDSWNDWFGVIYMESIGGDSKKGQFFTPYDVSLMCAKMSVGFSQDDDSPITINEPSCGAGGMIVAALEVLHERGINYQKRARIVANDIDIVCVHMCYVALSLLGVRAKVMHQNTITLQTWSVWFTPREILWPIMDYGFGSERTESEQNASECSQIASESIPEQKTGENTSEPENVENRKSEPKQMSLF